MLFVAVIVLYIIAYSYPSAEFVANVILASLIGLTGLDALLVFSGKDPIKVEREVNERLNLGDENHVRLFVENNNVQPINFSLIEGYPKEMQDRSTTYRGVLLPNGIKEFE